MTAAALAARMQRRARAVERELRAATRQLGVEALATSRKFLTADIYAQPVPTRPRSGKPMWKRTGQLRRAERVEVKAAAHEVRLINDQAYAEPRHEAGKPGRRKTRFPAPWRDQTVAVMKPRLPALVRAALQRALR